MPADRDFVISSACVVALLGATRCVDWWINRDTPTPTFPASGTPFKPLTEYSITLNPYIPYHLRPWTNQILQEAKQTIALGQNCNQLWTHGDLRVHLVLSDPPISIGMSDLMGDMSLTVGGSSYFTLEQITKTINEMAQHYGWTVTSGVDLPAAT